MPGVAPDTFDIFSEDYVTDRYEPAKFRNPYESALKKRRTEEMFMEDILSKRRAVLPTPAALTSTDYVQAS